MINDLVKFIQANARIYRKGEVVTEKVAGGLKVVNIDAFPAVPEDTTPVVDVHFVLIGFAADALGRKDEFVSLIKDAEQGEFTSMPLERIKGGPSYIEYGAWLGSQTLALAFLGLGELYGLWRVITPALFDVEGDAAQDMAGRGFVMNAGLKLEESV